MTKNPWLSRLTQRERMILYSVFWLILALLFYVLEYETLSKKESELSAKISGVENAVKNIRQTVGLIQNEKTGADLERVNLEVLGLQNTLHSMRSKIKGDPLDVVRTLRTHAEGWSLAMQSIDTTERMTQVENNAVRETTIELELLGRYQSFVRFIDALKQMPQAVKIYRLQMSREDLSIPEVRASMTLKLYSL